MEVRNPPPPPTSRAVLDKRAILQVSKHTTTVPFDPSILPSSRDDGILTGACIPFLFFFFFFLVWFRYGSRAGGEVEFFVSFLGLFVELA